METQELCKLGKVQDTMTGVKVFQFAISDLVEYLGANWSEYQILEAGELSYAEAYWMTLSELKLLTHRIKTSYYKSHRNFSPAVFMEWLQDYIGELNYERAEYFSKKERLAPKIDAKHADIPEGNIAPERIDALFAGLKETFTQAMRQDEAEEQENEERQLSSLRGKAESYHNREVPKAVQQEMDRLREEMNENNS